jgi:hypothetical protein
VTTSLWIVLGAAVVVVAVYLLTMRGLQRRSREVDKQVDFTKIRPLKDDEENP